MTASMNSGASGAQTNWNQPQRADWGNNQSTGGNHENQGGDVNGTMKTQMNANTTSGQPDNSELSRFMNNGGGPEPHQGSNPGAQSDPGPKEVGFYDKTTEHMGGDDGAWAAVERPSPMRMDGSMGAETRNPVGSAASYDSEVGGEAYEAYDEKPRVADKAGEVADSLKDKASGFFSRAVDRMEEFLDVDLNNDGTIGSSGAARVEPQAFETREKKTQAYPSNVDGTGGEHARMGIAPGASAQADDSFSVFYGGRGETDPIMYDSVKSPAQNSVSTRSGAKQRELVGA
ncbi:MAG: hypothetical protein IJ087_20900 [Eggerthellaceae bacterium]|nr:hypothetical protein [Eggerthellaceae bacterium]